MSTTFLFHGDLPLLLRGRWKGINPLTTLVNRRASVKDVIESFGLPHTEVGSIIMNDKEVDFNLIVEQGIVFDVYPVPSPWEVDKPSILRPTPLPTISFIVDVNVGRLARYLRAAGFDTLYDHRWNDEFIANMMQGEKRILLTRDMRLLMRKHVMFGRYVRATQPEKQLHEVLNLFGLTGTLDPFTRCLECNSLLQKVAKKEILHRLEPLTRKYYSSFSQCPHCDKIYWPGSHIENMARLLPEHSKSYQEITD